MISDSLKEGHPLYKVMKHMKLVPIELVIDAMLLLIQDDKFAGDIVRITPEYGVTVMGASKLWVAVSAA
ncbi:hypothetical protein THASP1DRAFT_33219 [Thamnocephalis sphaerospora]|uniref:Uncharacterized protein n=1 Tax=Thamnocephalis sphaerospora TaxID=78915 RepID=A0A4P9XI59_9FUNG|nr:hypothetical protein THASP1DRAFT_33219 [Thamnocephalis sphaerospora]|eukprot:RKP04960.1 hypothetical protein THASP1DRAFT_33219 [Thamnocephalis sphaerospora]